MARRTRGRHDNLPAELTSMVGRRIESGDIKRMLAASRLVTLTGTGGVGKTRLALHVARQVQAAFPDGLWLVPLADLAQPDLLALTVMSVLVRGDGVAGAGLAELTDWVGDRKLLLVLDNCEHVIEACAKLTTDLLRGCPNLQVLATSREPLRIDGEALFDVPPLPVPKGDVDALAASTSDSVRLFIERASSVYPDFSLSPEQEQAVCALCRCLDGLPLAIELAAIRSRALSIDELLARQNDRFQVLTSGSRTAPPRQRTLLAAVDYSYQLCSPEARLLWARMSVFSGGAGPEAIDAVCVGEGLSETGVSNALSELVDKSIVTFDGARYHMLETLREYGRQRLRERGEQRRIAAAHREHFARLVEEVAAGWFGPDQPALAGRVLIDHANLRAALEFCLTEPGEVTAGLRLASRLWQFWVGCGLQAEGRRWLDRMLAADPEPSRERVRALWAAAEVTVTCGDMAAAVPLLDECEALAEEVGDWDGMAHAKFVRGVAVSFLGRPDEGMPHLEEAVRLGRQLPTFAPQLPEALVNLGGVLCFGDRPELGRAGEMFEEAKALCAARGEQWVLSWCDVMLGLTAVFDGRPAAAAVLLRQGLARKRALRDMLGFSIAVDVLAWAHLDEGDAERAARLLGAGQSLAHLLGMRLFGTKRLLAAHEEYTGRTRAALGERAFDRALEYGRELGTDGAVAYALGESAPAWRPAGGGGEDLPLTQRERQIAELVATGKTNRQIAQELVIAVRTVDTHVENILAKLGFTSRTQIAALLAGRRESPDARTG